MIGKKGLFGKSMAPGGMPEAYSMPQAGTMQDGANLGASGAMRQKRPGLGTRLLGEGWEDKAMALGGALQGNQFAIPQYLRQQGEIRERAAMMAERQRQEAQMMAAAQGMGIDPQQAALLGPEGLRQVTVQRMKPEEAPKPRFEQDGAGNLWALDPATGQPLSDKPVFVDQTERLMNQNGAILRVRNPFAPASGGQSGGAPTRPVGRLTPIQPTIENTPAPQLGANGMPTSLTRAQYDAVLQRMGKADTEAWARRNNIRVTN